MSVAEGRYDDVRAVLGDQVFERVQSSRILVVGAGGIGCELIKNLVMTGFGGTGLIEVLDLDTIDLSNLNRQFLFQKQHVKRPKAVSALTGHKVARETALKFNPHVNIRALHRNIKDNEFNVDYFKSFDFVLNALDNLDARRHVNKMCMAANIPLLESGTQGYVGQVQPIFKDKTECFDCTVKPVPKTFAVCTIRSTPSTAQHCMAWAKTYLFPQLFGPQDDNDSQELDDAEKNGENVQEIAELRKENAAVKQLRATLTEPGADQRIFEKIWTRDIERLLKMEDMWKHRKPPHPLSWQTLSSSSGNVEQRLEQGATIKDQRQLSLQDSFALFVSSVDRLTKRLPTEPVIQFDKDDDDTLDFVTAAANLRASAFDIESQTRFQVKEYTGNIIPAIATTNAIIAGVLVLQAVQVIRKQLDQSRFVWLSRSSTKVFTVSPLPPPNPQCAICRVVYAPISFHPLCTLGQFVDDVIHSKLGIDPDHHVLVSEGARGLFESEDFEDNRAKTLEQLGVVQGTFVTVLDDDEPRWPVSFAVAKPLDAERNDNVMFEINADDLPNEIPLKPAPPAPSPPPAGLTNSLAQTTADDDDDDEILEVTTAADEQKKQQSKKRKAEEAELENGGEPRKASKAANGSSHPQQDSDDDDIIIEG